MDVSLLLADLHSFLEAYPGGYWKQQSDDTPMRTVKTEIRTLVKCQGEGILSCLGRIQDPQTSELVPYIRYFVAPFLFLLISVFVENY